MNINKHLAILTAVLVALAPTATLAQGKAESDPAYVPIDKVIDLTSLKPEVNINLPRFLLQDALSEFNGGPNDPFAAAGVNLADLVKDVKLIRFVLIEAKAESRAELAKGVQILRRNLEEKWTPLVTIPGEGIGVYAIGDPSGEAVGGLTLLINDGGDAIFANIVGRVSLAKIVKVASRFDKFPKDLLKKLSQTSSSAPANDRKEPKEKATH